MIRAQQPAPGEPDFRGFDWRYLYRLCSQSQGEIIANNASGFHCVDFAPDGRTAAFGTGEGMVEIFDLNSRQRVERWQAHSGVLAGLMLCPGNANWLATVSGDDGLLKLWDLARQRAVFTTKTVIGMHSLVKANLPFAGPAVFSPDERTMAVCNAMTPVLQFNVAL